MYASNNRASKHISKHWQLKQTDLQLKFRDFSNLSKIERTNGQNINKDIEDMSNLINLINICRTAYLTMTVHMIFK